MTFKTSWPVCSTCRSIPPAVFRNGTISEPHLLWSTFSAFVNSASSGCHACTLLYESVREPFKLRLETESVYLECTVVNEIDLPAVALTVDPESLHNRDTWNESLWKGDDGQQSKFKFAQIAEVKYVLDDQIIPETARHSKDLISLFEDDDGALRYIKKMLTKCLTEHNYTCNRVIFPLSATASQRDNVVNIVHSDHGLTVAPTRLIYVGSEGPDDPPRLVVGQECLKYGYLVLSYCWGAAPRPAPWELTTKTLQQFSEAIPLNILPQTLHDALIWTRKLGERYIWIDSMCIIQDSTDDWQREASRMASIYGSATVTLVAASSSVYGGITGRRNPLRNHAATLDLQGGSSPYTVYVLPNRQRNSATPPSPTDSRSWCYQEDLLSSRLIKFTPKTVAWQCVGDDSKPATRARGLEQLVNHPQHRWYPLWYQLVERYTNKSLSYPKDKLLAFYGIACDKAGSAYVAGFLKSDPWMSLLWCRDENQVRRRPGHRYDEYVAPSWSWASIDVPVLFYEAGAQYIRKLQLSPLHTDPKLHHAEAQPVSFFDTGAVKGGTIEISAQVAMTRTAPVRPFLFNTRQGVHTYGRRNCVDPTTGRLLGLIVFDIATEAQDDIDLCCVHLQTVDVSLWTKNGTAGLGLAVRVQEETAEHLKCTRVGYVQMTSTFGILCQERRLVMS